MRISDWSSDVFSADLSVRPHKMTFRFRCNSCGETHEGIPTFGADMPSIAQWISAADRPSRVDLGTDDCVVDGERFLVRGCLEIPVQGEADPFVWGVWVDLSQANFDQWVGAFKLKIGRASCRERVCQYG